MYVFENNYAKNCIIGTRKQQHKGGYVYEENYIRKSTCIWSDVWNGMYHDAKYSNKSSSGK